MKRTKSKSPGVDLESAGWWRINSIEWECTHCGHKIDMKLGEIRPPNCPECGGMKQNFNGEVIFKA